MSTKLIIQIPCYNEQETLPATLAELPHEISGIDEIEWLIIDDGSTDNTVEVALKNGVDYVVRHQSNRGLSRAFLTGLQAAISLGADIIVNTDADNQYPGRYIPELVQPILRDGADLVIGNRQPLSNQNFPLLKRWLEEFGSWLMRVISNTDVPDAPSGFRAYSRYVALRIQVYNSYSYTLETLIQAGKERMKIIHLPIETNASLRPSRLHKGILNFLWHQGGVILRSYVLYQPLKTFITLGVPCLLAGTFLIARFLYFYLLGLSGIARYVQSISIGSTLIIFGVLLVFLGLLGDAIRANRQALEEILAYQREQSINRRAGIENEILGSLIKKRKASYDENS